MRMMRRFLKSWSGGLTTLVVGAMLVVVGCQSGGVDERTPPPEAKYTAAEQIRMESTDADGNHVVYELTLSEDGYTFLGYATITRPDGTVETSNVEMPVPPVETVSVTADESGAEYINLEESGSMKVTSFQEGTDGTWKRFTMQPPEGGSPVTVTISNLQPADTGYTVPPAVGAIAGMCAGPQAVLCAKVIIALAVICSVVILTSMVLCYNQGGSWSFGWWPPCSGSCNSPTAPPVCCGCNEGGGGSGDAGTGGSGGSPDAGAGEPPDDGAGDGGTGGDTYGGPDDGSDR